MGPLPPKLKANQNPPCPGIFLRERMLLIRGWDAPLGTDGHVVDVTGGLIHVFMRPMNADGSSVYVDDPLGTGLKMEITRQYYVPVSLIDVMAVDMSRSANASFMNLTKLTSMRYTGGPGDEFVLGGGGNDTIDGAGGNDTIGGGPGNDSINTGTGTNVVLSGLGADTVNANAGDVIVDPTPEDTITRRNDA